MQKRILSFAAISAALIFGFSELSAQVFTTRDHRWPKRGRWMWALQRELPQLYREFNGIDFGHAHLAESLLKTQDEAQIEKARLEVLEFIFRSPSVPPDEEQIAPTMVRMVWDVQKTFNWTHILHRSLYDLFSADAVTDKHQAYREILDHYLSKREAITVHSLDHHGKLWSWPESKSFRQKFPKFNTQIWAYHWLQAAAYDVQLLGNSDVQRQWMPRTIQHYHGYLRSPPLEWKMMPMMAEAAPEFSRRFPEASAIFDNLHMLHDNLDDVLSRPDLYPTHQTRRNQILKIHEVYLHRNHEPQDRFSGYHAKRERHEMDMGARPPSVQEVLGLKAPSKHKAGDHGEKPPAEIHPKH